MSHQTIYSLASSLGGGVAVIRISGNKAKECLKALSIKNLPNPGEIVFRKIFDDQGKLIDECLVSFFAAPKSFTGEDTAEINIHPSKFIVKRIFSTLSKIDGVRLAEPGEFSKRAFENNKFDLAQLEAIPDLISSETESQHKQALRQLRGDLGKIYENWRAKILESLALVEAFIDFPEEDLPQDIVDGVESAIKSVKSEICSHLDDNRVGQKIKDGLSIVILGPPNAGKSSLLNFFAKSDVAIVSEIAGTTRDSIGVHLEIASIPVVMYDTAGIRKSKNKIESEGIKRALRKAENADIKILMLDATKKSQHKKYISQFSDPDTIIVYNKTDLTVSDSGIGISLITMDGTSELIKVIEERISLLTASIANPLITQERYRVALHDCLYALSEFSMSDEIEIACERLRIAASEIGKITGRTGVEDLLDIIFSRFCIGK